MSLPLLAALFFLAPGPAGAAARPDPTLSVEARAFKRARTHLALRTA